MEDNVNKETTLRDYLRILFRHKIIIIIPVIISIMTFYIKEEFKVQYYVATVKMKVSGFYKETADDVYQKIYFGRSLIFFHANEVKSRSVIERVVNSLKLYERPLDEVLKSSSRLRSVLIKRQLEKQKRKIEKMEPEERKAYLFALAVERLEAKISTSMEEDAFIFMIHVNDINPAAAVVIANALSRSYIIYDLEQQIADLQLKYGEKHISVIQLKNYVENLYEKLDGKILPDLEATGPASVKILEQAQMASPVGVVAKSRIVIMLFASFLFGLLLAFIFDLIDQTFRTPQDVERFLNIPVICSIPKKKSEDKLLISDANKSTAKYAQSIQNLSDQVHLLIKDKNLKSILITDAEGSGETAAIIANIGIYLARKGRYRLLIIDANLRSPSISRVLNIANRPGLIDVIEEKVPLEDAVQNVDTNLYVLPADETVFNPITILDSSAMSNVIKKATEQYDIVLFNCANLVNYTDAVILSSFTDAMALVINEGKVRRQAIESRIASLNQKKINIIGAIFNNRSFVIPEIIYKLT